MKPRRLGEVEAGGKRFEVFWIPVENAERALKMVDGFVEVARVERIFDVGTKEREVVERIAKEVSEKIENGNRVLIIMEHEFGSAPLEEGGRGWIHKRIKAVIGTWK